MRVGKPFQIKGIANSGDYFVPLMVVCRNCKRKFKIYAVDAFALELYGSRTIECMVCYPDWADVMEALGSHNRVQHLPVKRVVLSLEAL